MIKKKEEAITIRIKIDIKILTCHFAIFKGLCMGIAEMREKNKEKNGSFEPQRSSNVTTRCIREHLLR